MKELYILFIAGGLKHLFTSFGEYFILSFYFNFLNVHSTDKSFTGVLALTMYFG